MHRDTVTRSWGQLSCHSSHINLMFKHDNARPNVARICTQFLEAENVPVLPWPAYSPVMSPVEHVWDALDQLVRQTVPVLILYLRFFKVATLCLDDSFAHCCHSLYQLHEVECISINRCALLQVRLWNLFPSKCIWDNQLCCDKMGWCTE